MLSGGQAVVADFGIARALHAANADQLTLSGMVVGTPQYMSPEQAGGATVDGRSDQYSLACTVYEMLIGQPPFTGPSSHAVIARHSIEPGHSPSQGMRFPMRWSPRQEISWWPQRGHRSTSQPRACFLPGGTPQSGQCFW